MDHWTRNHVYSPISAKMTCSSLFIHNALYINKTLRGKLTLTFVSNSLDLILKLTEVYIIAVFVSCVLYCSLQYIVCIILFFLHVTCTSLFVLHHFFHCISLHSFTDICVIIVSNSIICLHTLIKKTASSPCVCVIGLFTLIVSTFYFDCFQQVVADLKL